MKSNKNVRHYIKVNEVSNLGLATETELVHVLVTVRASITSSTNVNVPLESMFHAFEVASN